MTTKRKTLPALISLSLALTAAPVLAQTAAGQAQDTTTHKVATPKPEQLKTILVTGSLIPQIDIETASPVQVITAKQIERSGLTTVSDVVRAISADNSGTIPSAFSNGFAAGATGVALRGLTANATLVLIDGQRLAYYALPDDGIRNFEDLNSIPLNAVERIEVLKDGASSIYGADAIGGVVNIILYRSFHGTRATVEMGTSQHGGGTMTRADLIAGTGNLDEDGHNAYIDIEYQRNDPISASERGYPFNSYNLSPLGGNNENFGVPGTTQGSIYGAVAPGMLTQPGNLLSGVPTGPFQPLRPCGPGTTPGSDAQGDTYCLQNVLGQYGGIAPQITRLGVDGRLTVKLNSDTTAYFNASLFTVQTISSNDTPIQIQNAAPQNTNTIALPPVLANGQLNPNDPFAASGQYALINYMFGDLPGEGNINYKNHNLRLEADLNGYWGPWRYDAAAVFNSTWLNQTNFGFIKYDQLFQDIQDGAYSFINPASNSPAVLAALAPPDSSQDATDLESANLTASRSDLWRLPGGHTGLGLGVQVMHEAQNEPALNPGNTYMGLGNSLVSGARNVASAYGELNLPLLKSLDADLSARFDDYSDFGSHLSPKIGIKWQPFKFFALRGTYSGGFIAPSFPEEAGSYSAGFTNISLPASYVAAHGNDGYVQPYQIETISNGNSQVKPETSRSWTFGFVLQPVNNLSATVDYYDIKINHVIVPLAFNTGPALNAYFAGQPIPPGYALTLDTPDANYPNLPPKPLAVTANYINGEGLYTKGVDVDLKAHFNLPDDMRWESEFTGTDILTWKQNSGSGYVQFVGTHGPFNLSSGAGTPKFRASWANTLVAGKFTTTATVYYVSHLYMSIPDITGTNACASTNNATGANFPANCSVPSLTYVDLNATYHLSHDIALFGGIDNLFDRGAGLDPIDYAGGPIPFGGNFNPTYQMAGIIGRFFQAGVRIRL